MTGFGFAAPLLAIGALLHPVDLAPPRAPAGIGGVLSASLCAEEPPADGPRTNGSWIDCYVSCVEAEREKCVDQCGSRDPLSNPCLAICYDAVALGCAIGCTHFASRPDIVIGQTP